MANPNKRQGTAEESDIVRRARALDLAAERLAEGGSQDLGDVRIRTSSPSGVWIGEIKNRERLNIHETLDKAIRKSGTEDTFVSWKRLRRREGNARRTQEGRVIVAVDRDRFLELLAEVEQLRRLI